MTTAAQAPPDLGAVVVPLLKGPLYRDTHELLWPQLLALRNQVSDYVAVLGLTCQVDEAEGYAYLRGRDGDADESGPRLVARRSLSFHVSLLLALLRKKLAEFDATNAETRLVLERDQIVEMVRIFLPATSNEARLVTNIDSYLAKVVDLGFLRRLRGSSTQFEVRRIIKAYVDAQWLADFDARLAAYAEQLAGPSLEGPSTGSGNEATGSGNEATGSANEATGSGNEATGSGDEATGSGDVATGEDE